MNTVRNIVKSVFSTRICRFLLAQHRALIFWWAMKRFLRDPEACINPGSSVIANLVYGWGNKSWSALEEYLGCCIRHALSSSGPVLECGSGLSTILIGLIAQRRGYSHWTLEHAPEWADKVQRYLNRYGIDSVVLCVRPLKDYNGFSWYNPPLESMPNSFTLVICDGPPAGTLGGRYGLVPIMRARLKPGCILLLDDAAREEEQAIASRWEAELGAHSEIFGFRQPYIKMTVGKG